MVILKVLGAIGVIAGIFIGGIILFFLIAFIAYGVDEATQRFKCGKALRKIGKIIGWIIFAAFITFMAAAVFCGVYEWLYGVQLIGGTS
jgi:hypothetical protein